MSGNVKLNGREPRQAKPEEDIPASIGIRTKEFTPLLVKWRARNPRVSWKHLLRDALRKELATLAGKRLAHLVEAGRWRP